VSDSPELHDEALEEAPPSEETAAAETEEVAAESAVVGETDESGDAELSDTETGDADAEPEEVVDPVAEFMTELRAMPGEWYVVHSYAGYENRVKTNIESRTQSLNMEDYIFQVEVPQHEVTEIKGGKRQKVSEKVLPG